MLVKIQKWGNSQGLRLTENLLADARLQVGDQVDIRVKDGTLIVAPPKRVRGKHRLEDLVAHIPENCQAGEAAWGEPVDKDLFNRSTCLAIVCPLTNTGRGFPFHFRGIILDLTKNTIALWRLIRNKFLIV